MSDISNIINELKELVSQGDDISDNAYKRLSLALQLETHEEAKKINGRLKKVEAVTELMEKRPSLLILLHQNPKKVITVLSGIMIIGFFILEVMWEYGLFPKFIEWFGGPPLLP